MSAPIAVYVHLPWCVRKCPYCDFNSHAVHGTIPESAYIDVLLADLDCDLGLAAGREAASIFLGGGTPSLFGPDAVAALISGIRARLPVLADAEVTMEANPGTVEHGRFAGYAAAGVNRVSLGAQTFSADALAAIGRIHGPDEIPSAVAEIRSAGIANLNLDLMYALPGQTLAAAVADVDAAIAQQPSHLSHYQLTLEPGTAFFHRPPPLPSDDLAWEMQLECQRRLEASGYAQYEISAYAQPAARCRHNLNYWRFGDYLGIGAGAHGKLTRDGAVIRTTKVRSPRAYLEGGGRAAERRRVPAEELPFEYMLNALRLRDGFTLAHFEAATGLPAAAVEATLERLAGRGLIGATGDSWRPTELGFRFLNELQAEFLPPAGPPPAGAKLCTAPRGLGPHADFRRFVRELR
jgi:oxygen-independent coproporphyrinogen-3 oxidase